MTLKVAQTSIVCSKFRGTLTRKERLFSCPGSEASLISGILMLSILFLAGENADGLYASLEEAKNMYQERLRLVL
jgi:hypothetical protein